MTIGLGLLLIAVGAVLRFAVTARVGGVNINTVGDILMAVGVVGLVIALAWLASTRRRTAVVGSSTVEQPTVEQPTYAAPVTTTPAPYPTRVEERPYDDPRL